MDPWKHRSANMKCATCMWYVKKEAVPDPVKEASLAVHGVGTKGVIGLEIGRCRRHAPTMTGYPVVYITDWCGDHKLGENVV